MGADEVQALLGKLDASPRDHELRVAAAEALDAAGRRDEAVAVLAAFVNVTGHDDDAGLPCLCKRCLPTAGPTAEAAGIPFQRSFAVANDRVLHFWMPSEMSGTRAAVRRSVADALETRLDRRKR
jgi:hypothetical protein